MSDRYAQTISLGDTEIAIVSAVRGGEATLRFADRPGVRPLKIDAGVIDRAMAADLAARRQGAPSYVIPLVTENGRLEEAAVAPDRFDALIAAMRAALAYAEGK